MSGDKTILDSIVAKCPHCKGRVDFKIAHTPKSMPWTIRADRTSGPVDLSIVCVTRGDEKVVPFIKIMAQHAKYLKAEYIVAVDVAQGMDGFVRLQNIAPLLMSVTTKGYIESVLQGVLKAAHAPYILRLDDDEIMSTAMLRWLKAREHIAHDAWRIPTAALWPDNKHFITSPPLWPDSHLRLITWDKTTWASDIHAGPPITGAMAPVCIQHYKYLIRSYEERLDIASKYDKIRDGAGTGIHLPFTLPEHYFDSITIHKLGLGYFPRPGNVVGEGKRIILKGGNSDGKRHL